MQCLVAIRAGERLSASGPFRREAFVRDGNGSWTCITPVTIDHPAGRIQVAPATTFIVGTNFMGVDLAAWLEERRRT